MNFPLSKLRAILSASFVNEPTTFIVSESTKIEQFVCFPSYDWDMHR